MRHRPPRSSLSDCVRHTVELSHGRGPPRRTPVTGHRRPDRYRTSPQAHQPQQPKGRVRGRDGPRRRGCGRSRCSSRGEEQCGADQSQSERARVHDQLNGGAPTPVTRNHPPPTATSAANRGPECQRAVCGRYTRIVRSATQTAPPRRIIVRVPPCRVAQVHDVDETAARHDLVTDPQFGGRAVHHPAPRRDPDRFRLPRNRPLARRTRIRRLASHGARDPLEPGRVDQAHHERGRVDADDPACRSQSNTASPTLNRPPPVIGAPVPRSAS